MNRTTLLILFGLFTATVEAQPIRVVNVFYLGDTGSLSITTQNDRGTSGFFTTKTLTLIASKITGCESGCTVKIKKIDDTRFSMTDQSNLKVVATIFVNDRDNLLNGQAFYLNPPPAKRSLVLELDKLSSALSAEITYE
jgi:hypothetical protein